MTDTTDILAPRRARGKMLRRIAATLALAFLPWLPTEAQAAKYASLVIDAASGQVLHSVDPDRQVHPASLTKMMTLYMLFDALEHGKVALDTRMPVSVRAAGQAPTKLALEPGEFLLVREAIPAMVIKSANDAAVITAEMLGGTEAEFAKMMTAKARALGMTQTTFHNASGLPHKAQFTTARDMAKLALALQRHFPQHYHHFAATEYDFRGETLRTHNKLLHSYDGADGIKTGYIRASGFNLVSSARRGKQRLVGVVFGGISPVDRNRHMAALLDKGFDSLDGRSGAPIADLAAVDGPVDASASEGDYDPAPVRKAAKRGKAKAERESKVAKVSRPAIRPTESDGDAEAPTAGGGGAFGVQVGAFQLPGQAKDAARKAMVKVAGATGGGTAHVETVQQKGKTVYRARVMGLSKDQAAKACKVLAKSKTPCLEVRATGIDQLAQAER
ncbi:MAG: D-alanyl-D-alanine carboxypeptidase [Magnetospirillum sp. WYHS-4]